VGREHDELTVHEGARHGIPPQHPADYAKAAAYVAQRWGSKLAALEVWNEFNNKTSGAPTTGSV